MDTLDFLDGPTPEPVAAPEPQAPPVADSPPAPVTDGPARGPDGKFAPKAATATAPAAEAAPQTPAIAPEAVTPPEAAAPPPDRVAELEAKVAGLTKALTATRQQARQPGPAPDPYEDFEAYQAFQENQRAIERAEYTRQIAELKFGPETVKQAQDWAADRFDADPMFKQRALAAPDPYVFAIEEWKRDQVYARLSDPTMLDKILALAAGQQPATQPAPAVTVAPPPSPSTPPRSMASAPNAGGAKPGAVPVGPNAAFDNFFKD